MDSEALEKNLNAGKMYGINLFYGKDLFLLESAVKKLKKNFGELVLGINYIVISDNFINELISNFEIPSFGFDKKLIILKDSGLFKKETKKKSNSANEQKDKLISFLNENIDKSEEATNVILFIENEVEQNDLFKWIEKNGCVCNFENLKPNQIVMRLKKICQMYKVILKDNVAQKLIETCGTDMQDLINELRKLIEYTGEGGEITGEAIELLAVKQIESVIFDLTDLLGQKNVSKALEVLDNLIYQKEPVQKILITLYNHFKKLYFCILATKYNMDIASSLNLKPNQMFLVSKYKKQATYFKENDLKEILNKFTDLDYKSKSGRIDIDIGLRSILCTYCS